MRGSAISIAVLFFVLTAATYFLVSKQQQTYQNSTLTETISVIDTKQIETALQQRHPVLVSITAPWCLTCQFNSHFRIHYLVIKQLQTVYNLQTINVNLTSYSPQIVDYMRQYGKTGLPLYVLYTPLLKNGVVLPSSLRAGDLNNILAHEFH